MKVLTIQEANRYLANLGMEVGSWNELAVTAAERESMGEPEWLNFQAPKGARALLCFSYLLAGWLPKGEWKLFQVDNSMSLSRAEASFCDRLVLNRKPSPSLSSSGSYLFTFGLDNDSDYEQELQLANLIFAILLFEGHAYLVSSGSGNSQYLGIQDGFAYFFGRGSHMSAAAEVLDAFQADPERYPEWVWQRDP